ncbi:hypothetical protein [Xanthobacter agilis]|uniref:WD40 repeat protein n=1 Tax=Xanthobacter agilis TaxID=47492 RepID=A0ABU0LBU6_XANAG|nr:hypothetical protein [Xanthobacter agilis]MDQ0504581.1 WD40 repeat protein [Xanthobacter agilis]
MKNMDRRMALGYMASAVFSGTLMGCAPVQENGSIMNKIKDIKLPDNLAIYSISPDAKYIVIAGSSTGIVFIVEVESGESHALMRFNIIPNTSFSWTSDGLILCVVTNNRATLFDSRKRTIISVHEIGTDEDLSLIGSHISPHGDMLYFQNLRHSKVNLNEIIAYDIHSDENVKLNYDILNKTYDDGAIFGGGVFMATSESIYLSLLSGRFIELIENEKNNSFFTHTAISMKFIGRDAKINTIKINDVSNDGGHKYPDTGRLALKCLTSVKSNNIIVLFSGNGPTFDSAMEVKYRPICCVYDTQSNIVSKFGGVGSSEDIFIGDICIHPDLDIVITTGNLISKNGKFSDGVISAWDLFTGKELRRIYEGRKPRKPSVSANGRVLCVTQDGYASIFSF